MADQKRWFKLWCSAPADDDIQKLPVVDRWAWAVFGAYTKLHGTRGKITVSASNVVLAGEMGVQIESLIGVIKRLPHMSVEEGISANGSVAVTWKNWQKYQEDSTVQERVARLRSKRRGEERRKEETRKEQEGAGSGVKNSLPGWIAALPFPAQPAEWWATTLALYPGLDHEAVLRDAAGYWLDHRGKYKSVPAYVKNQLARAFRRQREQANGEDPYAELPEYSDADFDTDGQLLPAAEARESARIAAEKARRR